MTLKRDIFLYVGLFFLVLGIFVSVSVPSLFHILALIPLILYVKKAFPGFKVPKSAVFLAGLMIWGTVSSIYNLSDLANPMRSFGKQKYIIYGLLALTAFPLFFKSYMTKKRIQFLVKTFLFTIIVAAIYGEIKARFNFDLLKMVTSNFGTTRNPGFTGIMRYGYGTGFVLSILFSLVLNLDKLKNLFPKKWILMATLFAVVGLVESQCRGAILGTVCSIPFILYFKNKKLGIASFVATSIAVITVIGLMAFGGNSSSRVFQSLSSPSNLIRLSQFEASGRALLERPIIGLGTNQFSYECPRIKKDYDIVWRNYCSKFNLTCEYEYAEEFCGHAHNIFLQTGADMGFVGLIFFTLWLLFWLYEMIKRKDLMGYIIAPMIINILIAGQFEYIFDANNSFMIFLIYPLSYLEKEHLNFSID